MAYWENAQTPILASVENIEKYVLAALANHNYLRQISNAIYNPHGFVMVQLITWKSETMSTEFTVLRI